VLHGFDVVMAWYCMDLVLLWLGVAWILCCYDLVLHGFHVVTGLVKTDLLLR
jgi:hypothetical protein